jgi:predicted aspartyl protease
LKRTILASTAARKPKPAPKTPILLATAKGAANYKVEVSMFVDTLGKEKRREKCRLQAVVDTGVAPVIVRLGALLEGVDIFPLTEAPLLVDAQRKALALVRVVSARIRLGDKCYDVSALVSEELSVDLILGTQFIDAHIRFINPCQRCLIMDQGEEILLSDSNYRKIQRVRITIPPRHEAVVSVCSEAEGLCLITTMRLRRVAVATGIHQLERGSTFLIVTGPNTLGVVFYALGILV